MPLPLKLCPGRPHINKSRGSNADHSHTTWFLTVKYISGDPMTDKSGPFHDRRKRGDRRSGIDRRSGKDRRSGADRRSGEDRRVGWEQIKDQRFQGVLRTTETVSHLFSQPLTVIMGYVDLLKSSTGEEDTKEKLTIIKSQLELISKYLQNLRNVQEYKTVDFAGVTLLDIEKTKNEEDN